MCYFLLIFFCFFTRPYLKVCLMTFSVCFRFLFNGNNSYFSLFLLRRCSVIHPGFFLLPHSRWRPTTAAPTPLCCRSSENPCINFLSPSLISLSTLTSLLNLPFVNFPTFLVFARLRFSLFLLRPVRLVKESCFEFLSSFN